MTEKPDDPPVDAAGSPSLPPLQALLPILEDYFLNLNTVIPLFDQTSFIRMLLDYSLSPSPTGNSLNAQEDPLFSAAIHAILALTYQHKATSLPPPYPNFTAEQSISAVGSLTSNLDLCSHSPRLQSRGNNSHHAQNQHGIRDLLGLQILLSFTIYHLGTPRAGAVAYLSALLGRIIKLVHRMELNRCDLTTHPFFDAETSLQRSRLFWLAYILDRHISMSSHDPPLQQDDDLDVPVPVSTPGYGLVNFTMATGRQIPFDFFSARIHLARVQGLIYSLIYSVRATGQPPESLAHGVQLIRGMLADWLSSLVPVELHPDNLASRMVLGPPAAMRELIALYFSYMFCLMHTHKVGHHHSEWIVRLVCYSQEIVVSGDAGMVTGGGGAEGNGTDGGIGSMASTSGSTTWVSSPGWSELVGTAKQCARLFRLVGRDDTALLW